MVDLLDKVIGSTIFGPGHEKIGRVKDIYLDTDTGVPTWATVSTGWFSENSLVPLAGASIDEDQSIQVPVDKETVKSAPHLDTGDEITADQQQELLRHYGVDERQAGWSADAMDVQAPPSPAGTDPASSASHAPGQRLRKYVVAGNETVEVPGAQSEARGVREPIRDPNAVGTTDLGDESREVTLHSNDVNVRKESDTDDDFVGRHERR